MEKERHRGTSRLQFSKEEQMQAVRAGQPERSHSPLLHQGIHAAHAQLHHQAAEANEDENSAVQAALTADDMQEEAFRAAAHAGKPPAAQCPLAAETRHPAGVCSRKIFPQASQSHCSRTEGSRKCSSQSRKHQERLRQTFARHPTAWAVLALAALLLR